MEWNCLYWLVEQDSYDRPVVYPLFMFEEHNQRESVDLEEMLSATMWGRRVVTGNGSSRNEWGHFHDTFWVHVELKEETTKKGSAAKDSPEIWTRLEYCPGWVWVNKELFVPVYKRWKESN